MVAFTGICVYAWLLLLWLWGVWYDVQFVFIFIGVYVLLTSKVIKGLALTVHIHGNFYNGKPLGNQDVSTPT